MQIDALAIRMRGRGSMEAADLGVRLSQRAMRAVYSCYLLVALPLAAICLSLYDIAGWLPALALWWSKPWLDRTVLFVLSRAAFGQPTTLADLWEARRQVWWQHLLSTLTLRRLSPWRSFTQPAYQLEGLSGAVARKRASRLKRGVIRSALSVAAAFGFAESALFIAAICLVFWLIPPEQAPDLYSLLTDKSSTWVGLVLSVGYALAILFLEPFYVGAGFGMYLNRRAELEAWDLEQELRRAFAQ